MMYWVFHEDQLATALAQWREQSPATDEAAEVNRIRDFLYSRMAREYGLLRGEDTSEISHAE